VAHNGRAGGAHHGIGHLVDDGVETGLDNREGDGVDGVHCGASGVATRLPVSSGLTTVPGVTTMVVSGQSMIAGPLNLPRTASRRTTGVSSATAEPKWTGRDAGAPKGTASAERKVRKSNGAPLRACACRRNTT